MDFQDKVHVLLFQDCSFDQVLDYNHDLERDCILDQLDCNLQLKGCNPQLMDYDLAQVIDSGWSWYDKDCRLVD